MDATTLDLSSALQRIKQLEFELARAQQLESVGRIAAGIAHEINTPVQFIGDTVHFLREGFTDLLQLLERFESLLEAAETQGFEPELTAQIRKTREHADLDLLKEEVPTSLERTHDGVARVAEIARAIKEFSYPEQKQKEAVDLNAALKNTLTIARNEYKYVADLETDLGRVPPVFCHIGNLNQVFLNLVINAAHAIEDRNGSDGERGRICVKTRTDYDTVLISIQDSGCGVPDEVRDRIFDAFFTTKEVGRGTGQGLAIARSVVVDQHRGTLTFETDPQTGTTFLIRLPVDGREDGATELER